MDVERAGAKYFAGYQPFINLTVGGQKRSGGDACNDLTYLIMDAVRFVKVYQPSLACRIHNQSPQKYMEKSSTSSRRGWASRPATSMTPISR